MPPSQARMATLRCSHCERLNRVDLDRIAQRPKCGGCGRPLTLEQSHKVSEQDFERLVREAPVPLLVDFYADWCGPCHMMAPTLEQVAREHAGKAIVLKVDTERDPGLSARFQIRGIPTLIVFRDGKETGRHVGVAQKGEVERLLRG